MKYLILVAMVLMVVLAGCSSFKCSIGLGYRSLPEQVASPIFTVQKEVVRGLLENNSIPLAISPAQIELILKFLSGENMKYFLPANSRNEVGIWTEIIAENK